MNEQCQCPKCRRQWDINTEQHACIDMFGECIHCRFVPCGKGSGSGTNADLDAIQEKRRQMLGLPRAVAGNGGGE